MKKILNKDKLLGMLIGGVIFGSVGVMATTYFSASQISFTPTNTDWNVTNIQEATDSLYMDLSKGKQSLIEALTSKGVEINSDASFSDMADSILNISVSDSFSFSGSFSGGCTMYSSYQGNTVARTEGTMYLTIEKDMVITYSNLTCSNCTSGSTVAAGTKLTFTFKKENSQSWGAGAYHTASASLSWSISGTSI